MKRITAILGLLLTLPLVSTVMAAETTVEGRVFANWMMNTSSGSNDFNAFSLDRSYVSAKSKLSDYTSVNITMDLRQVSIKDSSAVTQGIDFKGYTMILKYAYANWKPKFAADYLSLAFGLQPTKYIEAVDNNIWGRRYLEKSIGDLRGFLSTADLGLTANVNLGKKGTYGYAGLAVLNGTSYTDVTEKNKQKDLNPYVVFKPMPNDSNFSATQLVAQYYYGYQNVAFAGAKVGSDYKHDIVSVAGKLSYNDLFDAGFDLDWNKLGEGAGNSDKKQSAYSFFGALRLKKLAGESSLLRTLSLIGRVDIYDPNTSVSNDGNTYVIGGLECAPVKGVMAAINYRSTSYQNSATTKTSGLFLNTEFRF